MQCSNPASITSTATPYTVPTPATPTELACNWGTQSSASAVSGTLSWNAVSGAASYQWSVNGGSYTNVGTATSVSVTGTPGTSYTFNVQACSS